MGHSKKQGWWRTRAACWRARGLRGLIFIPAVSVALLVPSFSLAAVTISANVIVPATPNISQGDRARLRYSLTNNDTFARTNVTFTNTLPANVILYAPTSPGYQAPLTTCIGGTLSAAGSLISYTAGQLDPQAGLVDYVCFVEVDVTSIVAPLAVNTYTISGVPADYTDNTGQNALSPFSQTINVARLAAPTVTKTFGVNPLVQGNTTTVTLQIRNPNPGSDLPLTSFTDNLPANLTVVSAPASSCGGAGSFTASSITLTGGTVPAGNPGPCTLTFTVQGTLGAGVVTSGALNNVVTAGDVGNIRGLTNTGVTTPITVNSAVRVSKSFSPNPISTGQGGTASVTIFNDSVAPLTNVALTDQVGAGWPAQITNTAAPTVSAGCVGATINPGAGAQGFVLSTTTIAANGNCVISVPITSSTIGTWTNSIPVNAVTSTQGFASPAASSGLDVRDVTPNVSKGMSPTSAAPGDIVTYTVNVTTFNPVAQAAVSFTDNLPGGLQIVTVPVPGATAPTLSAACSNFVPDLTTPTAPKFTFDMPAAAAGGTLCTVTFKARVPSAAVPTSTIAANATGTISNAGLGINSPGASSGTISVLRPILVAKTFDNVAARVLPQGSASQLALTLTNNNFTALANVNLTDTLPTAPGQLRVANPANASTTCGGTFAPNAGDTVLTLTGGAVPARNTSTFVAGTCVIRVDVIGGTDGNTPPHTNTIPVGGVTANIPASSATGNFGAATPIANAVAATATLEYTPALTASKLFLTNPVTLGGVSRVRITLGNIGTGVLAGVSVTDPLTGTGLTIANPPNAASTCGGTPVTTAVAGGVNASLTGATIPAGSNCDFLFDVTSSTLTPSLNSIPPGNITASGGVANTTAVTQTLTKVASQVGLSKVFNPTSIASPGQPSQLTITINNNIPPNTALTSVGIVDNLPAGMVVAAVPNISTTCPGGTVTAVPGDNKITLTDASLAAAATCQVTADITSQFFGTLTNTLPIGSVTDDQGISNTTAQSSNLAALANLGVQKSFTPPSVQPNVRSQLQIRLNNSLAIPLTNITVTDNFPAGVTVAVPPNASSTCTGATLTSTTNSVTMANAGLAAGPSNCSIFIDVVATAAGAYVNVIPTGTVIANGGAISNPSPGATATLNVVLPAVISKAFSVSPVGPGQPSRLTVTVTNPNTTALTGSSLTDTLPAGLFIAPTPNAATTCAGGIAAATPSGTTLKLTGATVPASGACTFAVDTVSNVPATYLNTIPTAAFTSTQGATNVNPATATVQVLQFPTVSKTFNPVAISPTGTSRLSITLANTNLIAQTLTQNMDDNLPANVLVASPLPNIGGTCPGLPGSATAAANSGLVRYNSGGTIPPGGCTILVDVTSSVVGVYPNAIPVGGLVTNVGPNPAPAQATLTVSPLGAISGRIFRDANNDGMAQPADTGIAGQTVELLDSVGAVITTTTTDASGNYQFAGLVAGTYSVREPAQPAGTLNGITSAGTIANGVGTIGTPSTVATLPSVVSNISLVNTAGNVSSSPNNNFAEIVPSVISGTVYQDTNDNGIQNGTEAGIAGVAVTLSGVDDVGNAVTLNTTTDGAGAYSFPNLRPSCSPLAPPTCPGYVVTEGAQPVNSSNGIPTAGTVVDQTTSGSVGTAGTASNTAPAIGAAAPAPAIPVGTSRVSGIRLPANANSPGNNFGELPSNRTVSGSIFTDNNGDGLISVGDAGVAAQLLTLTGTDVNGNAVSTTTTSDVNGNYAFINLAPSANYTVTCTTCPAPGGYNNSATPLAYPGTTGGAAGGSSAVPLVSGINLNGTNIVSANNNFTKVPTGALVSGRVFFDTNNDGLIQAGEPGITGTTVELRDNGTNALIATTTTDASGNYRFNGLAAGTYKVVEPTQPPGTVDGKTRAGTINGVVTGAATAQGTVPSIISAIVLGAGQQSINNNFAETAVIGISGKVYVDANNNGIPDAGEAGIPNVTITLAGTDNTGNPVLRTTVTAADGSWTITGLPPSNGAGYSVTEAQPAAFLSGINTAGSAGGTVAGDVISGVVMASSASAINYNFGERGGSLSGFVYNDANGNATRQPVEPGIGGVTMTLSGIDATGAAVNATTTTAVDGSYSFPNLPVPNFAGYTIVRGALGGGFTPSAQNAGSFGGNAAVAGTLSAIPLTVPGSAGINYNFGATIAGVASLAGTVFFDANHNRALDAGDTGRAGWTVELITRADPLNNTSYSLIASATTDVSGNYLFSNLPPGTGYEIRFRAPGSNAVFGTPISPTAGVDLTYGTIRNLTLTPGLNIVSQNLPLDPGGVIYDAVTRQPVPGAAITITGPGGFNPAIHLVGGAANVTQITDITGLYQYLLLPTAPAGNYTLSVVAPAGYAPGVSVLIPPCTPVLNVGAVPNPTLIQNSNIPPALGTPLHVPATCPATSAGVPGGAGTTQYYFTFTLTAGVSANVLNNHIPLDPVLGGAILVQKSTPLVNVTRGDLVPYTVIATNTLGAALANVSLQDQIPPGFRYRPGTATVNGVALEPAISGRVLTWTGLNFAAGERKTFRMVLVVGAGVAEGQYVNSAYALNALLGTRISNVATATVRIVPDPTFDCSDIIGKVFDDRNVNGYQDDGEPGIANVRVVTPRGLLVTTDADGRFHVTCADVPNADRGANFVMKLDDRTLPSGYRMTTENPHSVRVTRGKMAELNFGAAIHRVVRVEVADAAFIAGTDQLQPEWQKKIDALPAQLKDKPSVVRVAYARAGEPPELAAKRVATLIAHIRERWKALGCCYPLTVEDEARTGSGQ